MQLSYNNKFKPQKHDLRLKKRVQAGLLVIFALGGSLLLILQISKSYVSHGHQRSYPKEHGLFQDDILTKSPLIFPSVEHAPFLRELTIDNIFNRQKEPNGEIKYLVTEPFEDGDLNSKVGGENEESSQMLRVKNAFLNHGKLKFNEQSASYSPEIVIVTGIDFDKYELSHLTKIVQNRVNYAQKQKYGIYVRWLQEFAPFVKNFRQNKEWIKVFMMRSAMYTFPNAKYFWYLDQDALIMRYDIDLYKYLLDPKALDPIMLRDQPIVPPNGIIHTFKNSKASSIDFTITQIGSDMNTNSFIIKNSFISKALLEFWSDPLYRSYHNFPKFAESAIQHLLQWHPVFLAHTGIVPPRTIAGLHTVMELPREGDDFHYSNGDFVVSLRECHLRKTCEQEIDLYWDKVQKSNK